MAQPLNPINVRTPVFDLESPEGREAGHRYLASGIVDLNQAIAALNTKIKAAPATSTTTTVFQSSGGGGGGGISSLGGVNDQVGVTSYTTQQSDNGAKIIVANAAPIAITLNAGVTTPWFTIIDNDSSGQANLTPSSGVLHGGQFIPEYGFGIVYFDGTDWWCGTTQIGRGVTASIATAPLTGGGTPGVMIFQDGILVDETPAT